MATQRSLFWVVGAKTGPFQTALKGMKKDLGDIQKTFTAAGKTLTAAITVPIVGIGVASAKTAISFESAFAGVRKTVDATEEEFGVLRKGLVDMTKEIPQTFEELSGIAEAAGQLGIKKDAVLGFTRVMADLGVTTNLAGDEAATTLARFANITQMSQQDFDRLGSTIVHLGNNLATTEAEIAEMGLRIAGAGETVGLTEAQILSLAGALSSVGIEAQAGGTAISRVMISLADTVATGGEKLGEFAQVAGMTAGQFEAAWKKDASLALVAFIEGLKGMQDEGKNVFAVLDRLGLSEIRVRDALLRASNAGELFRYSLEMGNKAWEENTALTEEARKRYETTEAQLDTLKNRVRAVGDTLGTALLPRINDLLREGGPVMEWVEGLAAKFAGLSEAQQTNILKWVGIAAATGPAMLVIGAVAGALKNLLGLLTFIGAHPVWIALFTAGAIGVAAGKAIRNILDQREEDRQADNMERDTRYREATGQQDFMGPIRVPEGWKPDAYEDRTVQPELKLADGGIVTRPTVALVGESGPEAVIPLKGGAGGISLSVNVQGSILGDAEMRRLARQFAEMMVRDMRLAGVNV